MTTDNNKKQIKVLQIAGGFREGVSGGVANLLYNYDKELNISKYSFDYLSIGYQCFEPYRTELESIGGHLYCLDVHNSKGIKGKYEYIKKLSSFLDEHSYDIIHLNFGTFFTLLLCTITAKLKSKAKVISHCHNNITYTCAKSIVINILKPLFNHYADYCCACSKEAGEYMFSAKTITGNRFIILKNAIDSSKFIYNKDICKEYRSGLHIGEELVVGHIGRFNAQKNHSFLLDIFSEIVKRRKDAKLILVGTGELEGKIRERVHELNLDDAVIFTGQRRDVNCLLQAMDVFVFPSLFEGLGIVAIEAQAAGMPVIASDRIPLGAKVSDGFIQLSLNDAPRIWAETVIKFANEYERRDARDVIITSGYDIKNSVKDLDSIYRYLADDL